MRKLNRVIAAGVLAVPMALGTSGVALAQGGSDDDFENCVEQSENPVDCLEESGDDDDNIIEEILNAILGEDDEDSGENGGNILDTGNSEDGESNSEGNLLN